MMFNPYVISAAILFLVVSHGFVFYKGTEYANYKRDSQQLEATNKAIEQAEVQEVKDNKVIEKEIVIQEKIKIEYRYIREKANENITKNPNYAECGLDDDGLRIFNSGTDAKTEPTSEPAS